MALPLIVIGGVILLGGFYYLSRKECPCCKKYDLLISCDTCSKEVCNECRDIKCDICNEKSCKCCFDGEICERCNKKACKSCIDEKCEVCDSYICKWCFSGKCKVCEKSICGACVENQDTCDFSRLCPEFRTCFHQNDFNSVKEKYNIALGEPENIEAWPQTYKGIIAYDHNTVQSLTSDWCDSKDAALDQLRVTAAYLNKAIIVKIMYETDKSSSGNYIYTVWKARGDAVSPRK
jgi:hypothetical protein